MGLRVSPIDLRLRVVAAALEPGIVLARVMALPLDDVQRLIAIGYFREARSRGLTLQQIARKLRKSVRTVATLSRQANELAPLLPSSSAVTCRRRVVEIVAARGSTTCGDVVHALPDTKRDEVRAAVQQLVEEGILVRDGESLSVAIAHLDLVADDADHRVDSLRHFLRSVTAVVYRRFFVNDGDAEAFARVLTFRASREALKAVRAKSYSDLRGEVLDLDSHAEDAEDAVQASVVVGFAEEPTDVFWRTRD